MIDYLEPLLRTPQALTQAVAELEDSRLRPQRREGRTNGEESVSPPKMSEWNAADWADEPEGVNRLSMGRHRLWTRCWRSIPPVCPCFIS